LKIQLIHIPEEGKQVDVTKDNAWFQENLPEADRGSMELASFSASCRLSKAGEAVYVEGTMEAALVMACGRCLEPARVELKNDFHYTFVPAAARADDEEGDVEVDDADAELCFYREEVIDLDPIFFEQIILQIPIKVLCDEACKGLCPRCGTNLNVAACSCELSAPVDPRMAILKKIKL
jgi:uncharacterized protein